MKNALILLVCAVGGLATAALPFEDVAEAAGDLIAVFAILSGFLPHIIALTAVIFEPGRLSSESVRAIGHEIGRVQTLNIGLFAIYGLSLFVFLALKMLLRHPSAVDFELVGGSAPIHWPAWWRGITIGSLISYLAGFLLTLSIVRTFRTLFNIRELQRVRAEVQARDAEARERAARAGAADRLHPVPDQGGAEYGKVVAPPLGVAQSGKSRKRGGNR